ncbi:sigma-54 interaction domain-containing protein, partial [Bilophila wadsworthia]|uniref:sigma-54 interaction domain-containing protein n=1 Tax=Bilophila wadsworthia TaxID=35833 RepID=UPI003AB158E8
VRTLATTEFSQEQIDRLMGTDALTPYTINNAFSLKNAQTSLREEDLASYLRIPLFTVGEATFQLIFCSNIAGTFTGELLGKLLRLTRPLGEELRDGFMDSGDVRAPEHIGSPMGSAVERLRAMRGMHELFTRIEQAAATDCTVLILGETGTGKELVADAVRELSARAGRPFVKVNCGAINEQLIDSELFGHERGAFTGASNQKIGLFEMADQGTLFIDEIGEMSPLIQTKLLRVLQEQRFMRVGGTAEIKSRFRLIAATNRDLWKEVREKRFRQDLLYRISVVPLLLPPLRERKQDILPLVDAFIRHSSQRYGKTIFPLSPEQKQALVDYSWPGNVRELKNIIERAVILCEQGASLHFHFDQANMEPFFSSQAGDGGILADTPTLEQLEERYLRKIMAMTRGRVRGEHGAAALLHMKIPTLYAKLRKFSIPCGKR